MVATPASSGPPPSPSVLVAHYGEIGLKKGNRRDFERRLRDRLREGLDHAGLVPRIEYEGGRYLIRLARGGEVPPPRDLARGLAVVRRIPGVANVAPAYVVASEIEAIAAAAARALQEAPRGSFKVETKRADKRFPMTSIDVSRAVAPVCLAATGRSVNVREPDVVVRVEILEQKTYVSAARVPGPGGLPVGSTSRLLAFLSGGIDSAVATWLLMRRGARVTAVHFHNRTQQGSAVLEKLADTCGVLAWSCGGMPLLVVPFEACQRQIVATVPAAYRMLVYRRAMFRIGAALARRERALGFVTGDSLGQVASQTGENLRTLHAASVLPVYAPLIGSDKREITAWARRIGTYEISIRPHDDCCSFLVARHPATTSRVEDVEAMEADLDWPALVREAVDGTERRVYPPDPSVLVS